MLARIAASMLQFVWTIFMAVLLVNIDQLAIFSVSFCLDEQEVERQTEVQRMPAFSTLCWQFTLLVMLSGRGRGPPDKD